MRTGMVRTLFGAAPRQTPSWSPLLTQRNAGRDQLSLSGLRSPRFEGHPDLARVLGGATLGPGAKSEGIRAAQQALLDLGFALPSGADGAFGQEMSRAITSFQTSQELPRTGSLDAATLRALDAVSPAPGKTAWEDPAVSPKAYQPAPKVEGKPARVLVDVSEHRLFLYDRDGKLERIYPVATGAAGTPTDPMIKKVVGISWDPSDIGRRLWQDPTVFGTRLLDLSRYDPVTRTLSRHGEEIHGTNTPSSIGKDVSKGCMRMFNADVEQLVKQVKVGDVVVVQR